MKRERDQEVERKREARKHKESRNDKERRIAKEGHGDGERGRVKERYRDDKDDTESKYSQDSERFRKIREKRDKESRRESRERTKDEQDEDQVEAPNFSTSGLLVKDTNTVNGVLLKYTEPPESRLPSARFRLYVFKGDAQIDVINISKQSAYLFGRERLVADVPTDHPSCSKQHAVLQYRQIVKANEFGEEETHIKLYVIDLESSNGTFVNGKKIPSSRYYQLLPGDVLKFGNSSRDYVLMDEDGI